MIILLLTMLSCAVSTAQEKGRARFIYGLEWGYTATVMNSYKYNYTDPDEGFNVNKEGTDIILNSNGLLMGSMGIESFGHLTSRLEFGWSGIKQERRVFPVLIKEAYHFRKCSENGAMVFISGGAAFHLKESFISTIGQAGAGYRIALSSSNAMDLMVGFQLCTDSPKIYENNAYIPDESVRKSSATYGALNLSVALSF